ncbi:MAG: hypothetical protein AAF726_02390 [Planctomycetota bacterium]
MKTIHALPAIALAAFLVPQSAEATASLDDRASLSRDVVPDGAAFVLHVDLQGLFASDLWSAIDASVGLSAALEDEAGLDDLASTWGIDPFRDVLSVTVVGDVGGGAAIVRTTDRIDGALDRLRAMPEARVAAHEGLGLEVWTVEDEQVWALVLGVEGSSEREIVIGEDASEVAAVARVMLGDAPSIVTARRPALRAKPNAGSFVYAEVGPSLLENLAATPASAFASRARGLALEVRESKGGLNAALRIATDSDASSESIASVVRGAQSLLELSGVLDEAPDEVMDLLDGLKIVTGERSVTVDLTIGMDDIRRALRDQ